MSFELVVIMAKPCSFLFLHSCLAVTICDKDVLSLLSECQVNRGGRYRVNEGSAPVPHLEPQPDRIHLFIHLSLSFRPSSCFLCVCILVCMSVYRCFLSPFIPSLSSLCRIVDMPSICVSLTFSFCVCVCVSLSLSLCVFPLYPDLSTPR